MSGFLRNSARVTASFRALSALIPVRPSAVSPSKDPESARGTRGSNRFRRARNCPRTRRNVIGLESLESLRWDICVAASPSGNVNFYSADEANCRAGKSSPSNVSTRVKLGGAFHPRATPGNMFHVQPSHTNRGRTFEPSFSLANLQRVIWIIELPLARLSLDLRNRLQERSELLNVRDMSPSESLSRRAIRSQIPRDQ